MEAEDGRRPSLYSFQGGNDGAFPAAGLIFARIARDLPN
jgi:hypothetical protein